MPFPDTIVTYLAEFDPDAPLIISRVVSTAFQSIPGALGAVLYDKPLDRASTTTTHATWATLSSGMLVSR
jgi:hypothetical protein